MPVTLMSFNTQHCMNFITKEVEYDSFAEEIRRHNADIIGLNEVYDQCDSGKFPAQVNTCRKAGILLLFCAGCEISRTRPLWKRNSIQIPDSLSRNHSYSEAGGSCL